jgi:PTH1 family peptidyl-tRNA hydrolase
MKVLIGLGNPGSKYVTTRHNIGFLFLDWLAQTKYNQSNFQNQKKFQAETLEIQTNEEKLLLVKPTTFMNLSGDSYSKIKNYYNLENSDITIIYDDIDLDFADYRYREKGSAGTHNGMRSILQHSETHEIPRLRLGINSEIREHYQLSDFVLANFSKDELSQLSNFFEKAYQKLEIN